MYCVLHLHLLFVSRQVVGGSVAIQSGVAHLAETQKNMEKLVRQQLRVNNTCLIQVIPGRLLEYIGYIM